ncbi:hypothetical protein Q7Y95_10375 [Glaesserella parasuis]|nr:hypothetical protein [Glaesserella parasuis]MDP0396115.1 hypothetical protein [Glaesserella parasuis]MDP0481507.1 hypothetical protein [Glaesserella parasuis]
MNTENYSKAESVTSSTVNLVQKHQIIEAVLSSIKITPYYDGLELKACKAISAINKYSDAEKVTISQGNSTEIKLEQPQLQKIVNDLNAQEKAITQPDSLDLYIDGVKLQEGKLTIFARTLQGETFSANIDADMLGDDGVNSIIDRIKDINTIKLGGMIKRRAGKIEQASFSSIVTEE